MKTNNHRIFWAAVLGVLLMPFGMRDASAGVSVNINLGPPPIFAPAPPEVVMIPGSSIYFVPNLNIDVFFYNGYWWSPRGGYWYRSRAYNGPWRTINRRYVPAPLFRIPGHYRGVYEREPRIPYGRWKHRERIERRQWREEHGGWNERGPGRSHGRDN